MWRSIARDVERDGDASRAMRRIRESYGGSPCGVKTISSRVRRRVTDESVARAVRASVDEMRACKEMQRASRRRRLSSRVRVDGDAIVREAIGALSRTASSWSELALALAALSGRRLSEILNGRSSFGVVGGNKYAARFRGQLKSRSSSSYIIPLLVPRDEFVAGLRSLRSKLNLSDRGLESNEDIERHLGSTVRLALARSPVYRTVGKVHHLRGVYAQIVRMSLHYYEDSPSDEIVIGDVLGHTLLETTLSYKHFDVTLRHPRPIGSWSEFARDGS